jgi:GNAT superfamily N-acetyltransferase
MMQMRPASEGEIDRLARLVVGERWQASTAALMRLFALQHLDDAIEMTRVMISSTEGWKSMVVADIDGNEPMGLVQVGEPFAALTPEIVDFAQRLYGEGFHEILGPRLEAMGRVQAAYPPGCLLIAEIHVSSEHRSEGIGGALLGHVVERARTEQVRLLGLQTLTTNPARSAFEAWGFEVADTLTDPAFEEFTGAAGYHFMLRQLLAWIHRFGGVW